MADDPERTAAFMTPAKLAQLKAAPPVAPSASASAWLDQMADDVGRSNVARLVELRDQMRAQGPLGDHAALAEALQAMRQSLSLLDFSLLQPKGWLARATGKARSAGAEFNDQYERIVQAAQNLKDTATAMQKKLHADSPASERTLVEFEVECSALEKICDQGARWLQDMRTELKARAQAAAGDDEAHRKVKDDAARCEMLLARIKLLRTVAVPARQLLQQAQEAAARRAAVLQSTQQFLAGPCKAWEAELGPVASTAESGTPATRIEGPTQAHAALQQQVDLVEGDCTQLQVQEKALASRIDALDIAAG